MGTGKKVAFVDGKFFTSNDEQLHAEAMLVDDGIITWIGNMADLPWNDCTFVNLQGKRVIPGFVDTHMHPIILADCAQKISCLPPEVNSIEDLKKAIREESKNKKAGEWIHGWGYDEEKFAEHRSPTRWDLDEVSEEFPVELLRSCAHIRTVNSKALELLGITRDTQDPAGGEIDRDATGEPTGILRENARNIVAEVVPKKSKEAVVDSMVGLGKLLLSQGVVAVTDMGNVDAVDYYDYYAEAVQKGFKQEVGIYYMWDLMQKNPSFSWNEERADRNRQIHINGIKLLGDGGIGGRTAWMRKPYKGTTDEYGISVCSDEELDTAVAFCKENHCQLALHAMGAKTIDRFIERIYREAPWVEGAPHVRIEHATDPSEDAIKKAAESKIAFAVQSIFMYCEIESYLNNLGSEWLKEINPIQKMIDSGVKVALSTDAPATSWANPSDPFPSIKCAVTRQAYDGTDCGSDNCLDIETTIKLYTKEGAELAGFEKIGQLKEGYKANFVILSDDILEIDPNRIDSIYVEQTYVDGVCVYQSKGIQKG